MCNYMPPKRGVIKVKAYMRRVRGNGNNNVMPKPKKMPVPRKRVAAPRKMPSPTYDQQTGWRKKADGVFDCHRCGAQQEYRKADYGLDPMDRVY